MGKERILFSKEIKVERIDKIIASQTNYSRKDVKKLISQKKVRVNDEIVKRPEQKFDEQQDTIYIDENKLDMKKHIYLVLNKPQGYISATEDRTAKTVLDLVPEQYMRKGLFPAGRLDKDTTGMMIITDDGEFAHNILAPRKHIEKTYRVQIDIDITEQMKENLKGKKNYIEESIAELEIHHKKQRKQLAEEFEKEKQINNARIIEMQNTTIEQEKDKPSFWNKIADKIFNFKIVATVSFVMYQLSNKVPPERILKNVKHFRKNYDKYVENPELIQRELKIMEYMDIGLSKIEESEKIDLNKEKSRDDYDLEL
jgi:pseudouridine synthase